MGKGKDKKTPAAATTTPSAPKQKTKGSSTAERLQGVLSGSVSSRGSLTGEGTGSFGASLSKSKQR